MINKEEVQHIAKLARLKLTEKEITKMQKDLSEILDYFNLLKKAPKLATAIRTSAKGLETLRKDQDISSIPETAKKLISAAPEKKDNYIKVKAIL